MENDKNTTKTDLETTISTLNDRLQSTEAQLSQVTAERDDALEKCVGFENYLARMGADFKESMQKVSQSIEWGASKPFKQQSFRQNKLIFFCR